MPFRASLPAPDNMDESDGWASLHSPPSRKRKTTPKRQPKRKLNLQSSRGRSRDRASHPPPPSARKRTPNVKVKSKLKSKQRPSKVGVKKKTPKKAVLKHAHASGRCRDRAIVARRKFNAERRVIRKPKRSGVVKPIHVSSDCTGFDPVVMSLQNIGLGHRIVEGFASDTLAYVRRFLDKNFQHSHIFSDILIRDNTTLKVDTPDIYSAGWPCQSFSPMGDEMGADDPRGIIGLQVAKTIKQLRPKSFILENVPQVLRAKHKVLLDCMRKMILSVKEFELFRFSLSLLVKFEQHSTKRNTKHH